MKKQVILVAVVFCIALLNLANFGPLFGPLLYTMTPLQRYYVADYLAATWYQHDPAATTETRLLWKTKKGKLELATEQDLVPLPLGEVIGKYSPEPFALSDKARADGWAAVTRGNSREVKSAMLENFLEQQVYDGNRVWRFFLQPVLGLATLLVIGLMIRAWRQEQWTRSMWDTRGRFRQLSFWAWSVEVSGRTVKRLLPRPRIQEVLSVTSIRQLELQAPAPKRFVAALVAPSEPKPAPQSVTVQLPAVTAAAKNPTNFPVAPEPKSAFIWDESQGID